MERITTPEPNAPPPKPYRRGWSFSLRSLLLFSMLCGAGMWVWRDWGPWVLWRTVKEEGRIVTEPLVDANDRLHVLITIEPNGILRHVVRDLGTGKLISTLDYEKAASFASIPTKPHSTSITVAFNGVDEAFLNSSMEALGFNPRPECLPMAVFANACGLILFADLRTLIYFEEIQTVNSIDQGTLYNSHYVVWKQIRPNKWYGVFILPPSWVAIALLAALVWSLRRDRM